MEVVVTFHEYDICRSERNYDNAHVEVMIDRQEDKADRDGKLQNHVDCRDKHMRHFQLVRHQLVGVLAMGLSEIFVELDAVAYCKHRVGTIDGEECEIGQVSCMKNQFAEGEKQYEGYADRADIACKALSFLSEIEEAENYEAKPNDI